MTIIRFLAATCLLALFAIRPASAQETTLRVGVLGTAPPMLLQGVAFDDLPLNTHDLSTATIDSALNTYLPTQFAPHYTRDKANGVFAKVESMRLQLNSQLAAAITTSGNGKLTVNSVSVNANPLEASFAQTPTGIGVDLTGMSVGVAVTYQVGIPLLCSSANGSFTVGNIDVGGDYDLPTGTLQSPRINYALQNVRVDCNGLLSGFTNFVIQTFFPNLATDLLSQGLQSAVNSQLGALQMREIFSVQDFLQGLRNASNIGILNDIANKAITSAQEVVANPSAIYRALKLTVRVSYGPSGNEIRFIASNAAPTDVGTISYSYISDYISIVTPQGTAGADLYEQDPGGLYWFYIGTIDANQPFLTTSAFAVGTQIAAVGYNSWIPDLRSPPGAVGSITYNGTCTDTTCNVLPCDGC
jgi:hypothetical protein